MSCNGHRRVSLAAWLLAILLANTPCATLEGPVPDPEQAARWVEEGLALGADRLDEAAERYRQALVVYEVLDDRDGQNQVHLLLATVASEQRNGQEALRHLDLCLAGLDPAHGSEDRLAIWLVETLAAEIELQAGSAARAVERSQHALDRLAQLDETGQQSKQQPDTRLLETYGRQSYCPNAANWRLLFDLPAAMQAMVRQLFRAMNFRGIGLGERALGHPSAAYAALSESKEKMGRFDLFGDELDHALVELARELDQLGPRRETLETSLARAVAAGDWRREHRLRVELAELDCAAGAQEEASAGLRQAMDLAELVAEDELAAETAQRLTALHCAGDEG